MQTSFLTKLAAGILTCGVLFTSTALQAEEGAEKQPPKRGPGAFGVVKSYDSASGQLVVENARTEETKTFAVPADTEVRKRGGEATTADLKEGTRVWVALDDKNNVKHVGIAPPRRDRGSDGERGPGKEGGKKGKKGEGKPQD